MHVILEEKGHFSKVLAHQQGVIERRTTVPILSHVMLRATPDSESPPHGAIKLTGTDLELTLQETLPAQVLVPGIVTLPVHMLYDIVRKLPDGIPVTLESCLDDSTISLQCGSSQFKLPTLPVSDFPAMADQESESTFPFEACDLYRLIDQTRLAMSTEGTRHYLNGIYLHKQADDLRAVATDAHRLALSWLPLPTNAQNIPGVILPRKTVTEVRKLLEGREGTLQISLSATQISIALDSSVLRSRLIEGQFPDYQRVIPQGNHRTILVKTHIFTEAVDRVSMIASYEKSRSVKMCVSPGKVTLSAQNTDRGSACEDIAVEYEGDPVEIGFNARYILDATQQIKGDLLKIKLGDGDVPVLLQDAMDEQALYILMPMRGI